MASSELDQLHEMRAGAEAEVAKLQGKIAPLQKRLASARERLELIRRLIGIEDGERRTSPGRATLASGELPSPGGFEEQMFAILKAYGHPMHVSDLRGALVDKGVPIPGRGTEANVISRLNRASDVFVRTARGTYGLAEWGIASAKPGRHKTRRRKAAKVGRRGAS